MSKELLVKIVKLIRLNEQSRQSDGILMQELDKVMNEIKKEIKQEVKKEMKL